MSTGTVFEVVDVGTLEPFGLRSTGKLAAGEARLLDRLHQIGRGIPAWAIPSRWRITPPLRPAPASRQAQPMVFAGIYPADGARYGDLREALEKLQLNDAALTFDPETSVALGFGFRCGFLGLLHMEIIEERLEREFNLDRLPPPPASFTKSPEPTARSSWTTPNYPSPTLSGRRGSRSSRRISSRRWSTSAV